MATIALGAPSLCFNLRSFAPSHLFLGDLSTYRVSASSQAAGDGQSFGRGRVGDEPHHCLIVAQGFATPVGGNERKEPMLHFVPLAGSWGEVAHGDRKARLVRQAL